MPSKENNIPTVLVVLGVTGDLMAKKIAPALFSLFKEKQLPDRFKIIGFSRRNWDDSGLREHIGGILAKRGVDARSGEAKAFLALFSHAYGHFEDRKGYDGLKDTLDSIDQNWGMCSSKLFYLSVPPELYKTILTHLSASHLTDPCGPNEGWTRVLVEKPFGSDEKSAKALDALLVGLFEEEQIYRIDHYLAKEMLQNLLTFRFGNNLFENEWDKNLIEKVDLRLFESIGVEDRGSFYDKVGALRDVGQNHLLQMLALIAMERPAVFTAEAVRARRSELLRLVKIPDRDEIKTGTFRAQYNGYHDAKGVAFASTTETYFKVRAYVDSPRWDEVPFVMESGKRMGEALKEAEITLRHQKPCMCPDGKHFKNRLIIQMEPKESITVKFWSKKPGTLHAFEEREFVFEFRGAGKKAQYTEEYEKLLLDAVRGDQTLFVSSEEIEAMWRYVDPIIRGWEKGIVPLHRYAPDSRAFLKETAFIDDARLFEPLARKEIAVIGLGKMGKGVALQLKEKGWRVLGYNRHAEAAKELEKDGIEAVSALEEISEKLQGPRIFWVMITAGKGVDDIIFDKDGLWPHLKKGDTVIDSGNSFYEDSMRRAKRLAKIGVAFMDVGFSGGPRGARHGGSLMIGGDEKTFKKIEELFADLSVSGGYQYFGKAGAGHFVKMVHNGIEYGMMQALAEGFAVMKKSPFKLDLEKIATIYNRGSVIESRLVGWLKNAYKEYGEDLKEMSGSVAHTGEGEWTVKTAKKFKVPAPVIEDSFKFRVRSAKQPSYIGKILTALRNQFGGHAIKKER